MAARWKLPRIWSTTLAPMASNCGSSNLPTTLPKVSARCIPQPLPCASIGELPSSVREILRGLEERGIDFDELAAATNHPEADPFDLLCHLAFNAPLRTRRERAERLRREQKDFFERLRRRSPCNSR